MVLNARISGLQASVGFSSEIGPRARNEDFAGAVFGAELPEPRRDVIAVIADGIGSTKGGRVAAETAVRTFLGGMFDLPDTMEVQRAAATILNSINGWLYSQGRRDPDLSGMGCTFTALVLRGRRVHVLHAGDTRAYRLRSGRLSQLTSDHVREGRDGRSHVLNRALGVEAEVRLEYASHPLALHDRFLLCSDGVHAFLSDATIAQILSCGSAPADAARELAATALDSGSNDNHTALVLDVVGLSMVDSSQIEPELLQLPLIPVPAGGETVDGFVLRTVVSDGTYSRLYAATDEIDGGDVALKFPKAQVAAIAAQRAAFVREAWVGAHANCPWLGRTIELPTGRQTCLYTVMPLYQGERLDVRAARRPSIGLEEGRNIALKLARAAAALHRLGIIHRDIKPDNVILESGGSLKLIDLGVVRVPGLEDFPPEDIPGTRAYMAPEMFTGEAGNEATDVYALGVTMFVAFTGEYPYGNGDAAAPPRRARPVELCALRPDLPAWLQAVIGRALAADPAERLRDMGEFAMEMEAGPARIAAPVRRPPTLYERAPVRFWQGVAALLALALLISLLRR